MGRRRGVSEWIDACRIRHMKNVMLGSLGNERYGLGVHSAFRTEALHCNNFFRVVRIREEDLVARVQYKRGVRMATSGEWQRKLD